MTIEINYEALSALSISDLYRLRDDFEKKADGNKGSYDVQAFLAIQQELNRRKDNLFII